MTEDPPYCIQCEVPMLKGFHKSWICRQCGYLLDRTVRVEIEWLDGTILKGRIE